MSKLQDLIDSLCPNGVEFKPLGEVCEILDSQRKPVSKGNRITGQYPYYGANGIQDYVNEYLFDGTFILVGEDGSVINADNSPIINWAEGRIWVNNHAHILAEINGIKLRYLYYALQLKDVSDIVRGTPPKLNQANLKNILIPLPPLPVQEEIVRILDRFSNYAAELQAELQARKEQYEYYRNLLLTFNPSACGCGTDDKQKDNVIAHPSTTYKIQWKKMGEIGKLITTRINADEVNTYVGVENLLKDRAGCIPSNELPIGDSHIGFNINDILIGNIRPYLKKIWLADRNGGTNGDVLTIRLIDTELSPKFLYHVLASDAFFFYHNQYAKGAKMPRGDKDMVMKYLIPIPPIELQEKIAAILDRFETLVNDISKGLPAEIEAQKTRYEYYRNKLLTFKPLPA